MSNQNPSHPTPDPHNTAGPRHGSDPRNGAGPRDLPDPRNDRPVGRGERRAWNTATAVVGGVGALALLLGGAGTATAVAMTQERDGSWTASSDVDQIRIDAPSGMVSVNTSPTVDRVQVQWHESGWSLSERGIIPSVRDGVLQLDVPDRPSQWGSGVQSVSITVPQDGPRTSLDLKSGTGAVHVNGTYRDVRARTDLGSISATDVEAAVFDAHATTGQVLLDGVSVKNRLDAHTNQGGALVNVRGTAPQRTSVTATSGVYGISMPAADYWYPQDSQRDVADPRHPVTTTPGSNDRPGGARSSGAPTSPDYTGDDAARPSEVSADTVCAAAPEGQPCLFVSGTPVGVNDYSYMREWSQGWDEVAREYGEAPRSSERAAESKQPIDRATDAATASPTGCSTPSPADGN